MMYSLSLATLTRLANGRIYPFWLLRKTVSEWSSYRAGYLCRKWVPCNLLSAGPFLFLDPFPSKLFPCNVQFSVHKKNIGSGKVMHNMKLRTPSTPSFYNQKDSYRLTFSSLSFSD